MSADMRGVLALVLAFGLLQDPSPVQEPVDPALRSAVDRFFATQVAEDVDGYLALWSATAKRPRPEMLKYVFESGDDQFLDVRVDRVMMRGERARVRVSATRIRTQPPRTAGGPPITRKSTMDVSLTFVREGGDWKLLREGPAADDLAAALIESASAEERQQLLVSEPELLNERLLLAISRQAAEAAQMQNFAAAETRYERLLEAARHVGDRKYEGEALQNLANAYYYQRNLPAALELYEQRVALERERGDDEAAAAALGGIATIRYAYAEYGAALDAYREALATYERLDDQVTVANTLISTGNVLYLQGDFTGAIADYTRSRDIYRTATNPAGEARALEGLGRVLLARGDYARALDAFSGVLAEGRARKDSILQGNATLNIGDAHLRLGNLEVARSTFEESRGHFEAVKDLANAGRVWQAIALTDLIGGRYAEAEDEYKKSRANCAQAADQECVAGAAVGLGFAQSAQDKFADAIASYGTAIKLLTELKRREGLARAQIGLSQALSGNGDYEAAQKTAEEARQHGTVLDNDDVVWRALVAEARALRRLKESNAALAAARAAESALAQQVERSATRPANPVSRDSAAVFTILAVLQAEVGDPAAAFETAERMHVHDLRIGLAGVEREISRGMTDAEREAERALAAELVTLDAQLSRERDLPKPDPARLERLERSAADARARRTLQQQALFTRLPDLRIWRGLFDPATRAEAEATLTDPGTVLIEFVVDDEDLAVLWARRGESGVEYAAAVHPLTRKALARTISKMMTPEVLKDPRAWRKAALPVAEAFPAPLRSALADSSRAIIVPHDILWGVPFEALPDEDGYLADTVRVRYASSLSARLRVPSDEPASETAADDAAVLIAAAPELHATVRQRVEQTAPGWVLRSAESAMAEVAAIGAVAENEPVTLLTGAAPTESALRDSLPAADVIHLALPFRVNGASALFSPILTSGDPGGGPEEERTDPADNASLEAREVINLPLRARIVILSDGGAMSMRDAADDLPMLRWAWRAAGVKSLLVPRWSTEGGESNALLADLHAKLRAGERPAGALDEARKAIRGADGWGAPFYWAGWFLMGDREQEEGGRR